MKKDLEEEWRKFHQELYLPGSAINTNTIFDWWEKKIKEARKETLEEVDDILNRNGIYNAIQETLYKLKSLKK